MKATKSNPWVDPETGAKLWRCADGCKLVFAQLADGSATEAMAHYRWLYSVSGGQLDGPTRRYLEQEDD